ncbi:uncharacterized protein LOC123700369 isoform X1 [Colias croceus]|uniref:uncharacterized protein LOC123700369 isoform X1 n=1 Tax=Colias crocea TaxID=72248 RepID=UPI001E27EC8E|nr:uncharacterized protein LOC123700369 isoform X1 [Colias croceus]
MKIKLEGNHLGARHKHLNTLAVQSNDNYCFDTVDLKDGDVVNLIKIDIAGKHRNVDYILKVLKCDDLLLVSRAINRCQWLITESQYKHIINPEYLHQTLFPQMSSKAVVKLYKCVKLHLKDSERVEQFYKYEDDSKKAAQWLPHCSVDFINLNINKHDEHIDITLLKRLCEKTIRALEVFIDKNEYSTKKALKATSFLLRYDLIRYLDIIEKQLYCAIPDYNKNSTELMMKHASDRIVKKIATYCDHIDIKTFIKYVKKENIKNFLFDIVKENNIRSRGLRFDTMISFISAMSDNDRIEFVTQVLIDKVYVDDKCTLPKTLKCSMEEFAKFMSGFECMYTFDHFWYRYTTFNVAFTKIQELIDNQSSNDALNSMFETLIIVAGDSVDNLKSLIEYYSIDYKNSKQVRKTFIKCLFTKNNFQNYDCGTWNILEEEFMSEVFKETNDDKRSDKCLTICVEAVIIYYTLHMKKVPKIVENKFKFNSLKSYQKKLNSNEKDILFTYLYNTIMRQLNSHSSFTKEEFIEKTELLDKALNLLIDWDKDIGNYPAVVNAIKGLININEQNMWDVDLTNIYNKKKSWRKNLFNESLKINPSQPVLINALKHDPLLIERHQDKLENIYFNNKIFLKQYHKKIKTYWSESLAKQMVNVYLNKINNLKCSKAVIRALCILLPDEDLQKFIIEYAPKEEKVDWNNTTELTLIIQQNLAKIMHIARPQPSPKLILHYSKGDYLPYALPSLYSIFLNLNMTYSQQFIPMLIDTKVSLQKHGIRFAFKLPPEDVKNILSKVLNEHKNSSIRHIAFKLTHKLLCRETDPERILSIWNIMETFLDNLSDNENDAFYELLLNVDRVPTSVRHYYYVKSYNILKSHIASKNSEELRYTYSFKNSFISYARNIIDQLPPEFISEILLEYIDKDLVKDIHNHSRLELVSSYMLSCTDEEVQMKKYSNLLLPLLNKCFKNWNETNADKKQVKLVLDVFLDTIRTDIKEYVYEKKNIVPKKLFETISSELLKNLDYPSNYILMIKWQLTVAFVDILDKCDTSDWDLACESLVSEYSKVCIDYIIDHCSKYFSNMYVLFAQALYNCVNNFIPTNALYILFKKILQDEKNVQVYLAVLKLLNNFYSNASSDDIVNHVDEIFKIVSDHPSVEVQIHYYHCRNVHLNKITDSIYVRNMHELDSDSSELISLNE